MQRNASPRRFLLVSMLGLAAAVLATPLLPRTAQACGPYGAPSLADRANFAAADEHYRHDQTRFVVGHQATIDDDRAKVRLLLQDEDGRSFERTVVLSLDEGAWSVSRVGKVRARRRTA